MDNITIGIQNKEITEAGTLIISMNPVNNAKWISTAELIAAEVAVVSYGVISVPEYETIEADDLIIYVNIDNIIWQTSLATLIAGAIGDEIEFSIGSSGGGGGANDAEITKWIEGNPFTLTDMSASFIQSNAFKATPLLSGVEFANVTYISSYAFQSCQSLITASFANVESIYNSAFQSNINLKTFYAPKVTEIRAGAFYFCSALESFETLDNVTTLGSSAFYGCYKLSGSINIGISGTLSADAFRKCSSIETFTADNVSLISASCFQDCIKLNDISFAKVQTIEQGAFSNCPALTSVHLPQCLSIGTNAFMGCTNLETLDIGESYPQANSGTFGANVFSGCTKLASIYIRRIGSRAMTLQSTAQYNTFNNCPITDSTYLGYYGSIYIPSEMYSLYEASTAWTSLMPRIVSY